MFFQLDQDLKHFFYLYLLQLEIKESRSRTTKKGLLLCLEMVFEVKLKHVNFQTLTCPKCFVQKVAKLKLKTPLK